jgi:hypothetical protein
LSAKRPKYQPPIGRSTKPTAKMPLVAMIWTSGSLLGKNCEEK